MRHRKYTQEQASKMGKRSQEVQRNYRLEHLVNLRPINSITMFKIHTENPLSGIEHHIEIRHEIINGNDRYNVYLDGELWRNQWSRSRFTKWLFKQIDSVRMAT